MTKAYYTKYLVPTESNNVGYTSHYDKSFKTNDYMFLDSTEEIARTKLGREFYRSSATDYCLANGITQMSYIETATGDPVAQWWTRTPYSSTMVERYNSYGDLMETQVNQTSVMVCPSTQLDVQDVVNQRQISDELFNIKEVKNTKGETAYHTISFGWFPQNFIGEEQNNELEIR